MAYPTLDDMIQRCATDVDEAPLPKSNGMYVGNQKIIADKIITGINEAYLSIVKERWQLIQSDPVTLDANNSFNVSSLTRSLIEIKDIDSGPNYSINWIRRFGDSVMCPGIKEGDTVTVHYAYLPDKLVNLTDAPLLPEAKVPASVLCNFASYYYLSLESDDISQERSRNFLALYNAGLDEINPDYGETHVVRNVYNIW